MNGRFDAVIFDFDGVIADSELIGNASLAAALTAIGLPTTVEESIRDHMGRNWRDNVATIEARLGRPLPEGFVAAREADLRARVERELTAVPGLEAFLDTMGDRRHAIASSSTHEWIALCLGRLALADRFGPLRFSGATDVARGKPFPDLFLHAARAMAVDPARCLVVEDSEAGVRAGVAAGMTVVGLLAGSHIRPRHGDRLRSAGAHSVASRWMDVALSL